MKNKLIAFLVFLSLTLLIGLGYGIRTLLYVTVNFDPLVSGQVMYDIKNIQPETLVAIKPSSDFKQVVSGYIQRKQKEINKEQLQDITKWLQEHQNGWGPLLSTPSVNATDGFLVELKHLNDHTSDLGFRRASGGWWTVMLTMNSPHPPHSHYNPDVIAIQNFREDDLTPFLDLIKK